MKTNLIIPSFGESIASALIARWYVEDGDYVEQGDMLCSLETDKVASDLESPCAGILHIVAREGAEYPIGAEIGSIAPAEEAGLSPRVREDSVASVEVETVEPVVVKALSSAPLLSKNTPIQRTQRKPMSPLRRKIAENLVAAQHQAAMLTTFNECDMSAVMALRKQFNVEFIERYQTKLGFMSFFIKASVLALQEVPALNARIDGTDIIQNFFYDISVAIGSDKGLMVPVLRDCDQQNLAQLEISLSEMARRVREGKISLDDLRGGVFTISNGGTYGSLLSTPVLNPPQSAILGMHAIKERPVVANGEIVIRPMMNLALSYDHRLIDGKQAVAFLICIKNFIENPIIDC